MSDQTIDPQPTLNGTAISPSQLQEEKDKLKNNERIVEVTGKPGDFRKLTRMQE